MLQKNKNFTKKILNKKIKNEIIENEKGSNKNGSKIKMQNILNSKKEILRKFRIVLCNQ